VINYLPTFLLGAPKLDDVGMGLDDVTPRNGASAPVSDCNEVEQVVQEVLDRTLSALAVFALQHNLNIK
jgi:hypothetical protein